MNKKEAIKKIVKLMSKFNITTQDILDYCRDKLVKETMEVKARIKKIKDEKVC